MSHVFYYWLTLFIYGVVMMGFGYGICAILTRSKMTELEAQIDALQRRMENLGGGK